MWEALSRLSKSYRSVGISCVALLWHWTAGYSRRTHLGQHPVQPLEGSVQMKFNPTGGRRHCLPPVLSAPTLHKAHSNCTHSGQLIDRFEALTHWLSQKSGELLIVEYFEVTSYGKISDCQWMLVMVSHVNGCCPTWWYFTDGSRVPAVSLVAIGALHKYAAIAETFSKHLTADVIEPNASTLKQLVWDIRVLSKGLYQYRYVFAFVRLSHCDWRLKGDLNKNAQNWTDLWIRRQLVTAVTRGKSRRLECWVHSMRLSTKRPAHCRSPVVRPVEDSGRISTMCLPMERTYEMVVNNHQSIPMLSVPFWSWLSPSSLI